MEEQIISILNEDAGSDIDWQKEKAIIDDELIDSLDLVAIVSDLNEAFDVTIGVEEMVPANFNSVAAIAAMIAGLQNVQG